MVGLFNGVFPLYELPDAITREDKAVDYGLCEWDGAVAKGRMIELQSDKNILGRRVGR